MLAYLVGERRGHGWLVTPGEVHHFALPAAEDVRQRVAVARARWAEPDSRLASLRAASRDLFDTLLAPVAGQLKPGDELVVLADGPLSAVPFEALAPPQGAADAPVYLGDSHPVRYAPSAAWWVLGSRGRDDAWPAGPALLVGDPEYPFDDCGASRAMARAPAPRSALLDERWSRLCHARAELEAIRRGRGRAEDRALLGTDARVPALLAALAERPWPVVHIAAHAVAYEGAAAFSALVLSPADGHDGFLELSEVDHLEVDSRLVVLSGCYTAAGQVQPGDADHSLARAFMLQGAHNVLAGRWAVDDAASAAFMQAVHAEWRRRPLSEAVHAARQAMRRGELGAQREHPYYWAAFGLHTGR